MTVEIQPSRDTNKRFRLALCRSALYSVLAQALATPTRSLCDAAESGELATLVKDAIARMPLSYRCGLNSRAWSTNGGNSEEAVTVEYTRLFALNVHCPQYEADYLGHSAFNWSQVISGVSNMYSAFGVQLGEGVKERPDHIAVELDFMNLLAAREARARELGDRERTRIHRDAQRLFFASHLSQWGPDFARALREETRIDFYRSVAGLLDVFLGAEARYLKTQLGRMEAPEPATQGPAPQPEAISACACDENAAAPSTLTQLNATGPSHQLDPLMERNRPCHRQLDAKR